MNTVDVHNRGSRTTDVYETLLGLRPKGRVVAGMLSIAGGVLLSVLLWNRGVLWGLPLFAWVGGLFLFFSGLSGLRREKERRALLASVAARKDDLLDGMLAEKRDGRNPVRWLNDQGITDAEVRTLLIDAMNERLKRPSGK